MTKHYDATPPYVEAAEGMVLCDGNSIGSRVYAKNIADLEAWQEMTEAEAEALVNREEISDEEFGAMVREVL